ADWCTVDMLEPDGELRRIAVAQADPPNAELARVVATCPPDPRGTHLRTKVVRAGRSELFPGVTEEALVAAAADSEQLAVLRRLGTGKLEATKMPRALEAIERNVASLTRMVEDLTDVSRFAAGKLRLKAGPVDLREVIAAAIVAVRPAAQAKGIRLESIHRGAA